MSPLVSILIPCYNAEQWIGHAIESALAQSHEVIEVIVVDDGSSDKSISIIKSYSDRITFETGPNRGGNVTRNRLMQLAKGEWLQFLDADDYLKPDKIRNQLKDASSDADLVYSPITMLEAHGNEQPQESISAPNTKADIYTQWINWQLCQTGAVLWRKKSLEAIGRWNETYPCCQDNEVCLRALKNKLNFSYSSDAGAVYRVWSEDTVCRKSPEKVIRHKTQLIDDMLDWLRETKLLTKEHEHAAALACFAMARSYASHDLSMAGQYVKERKSHNLFQLGGPAAPLKYRILYKLFGFGLAERIAASLR